MNSDTDYSVFVKDNIPGIDIAFYSPRSYYHTHRDNLENTSPEALQYMGQYALEAVKAIANSDDMLKTEKKHEAFVYYDILGRIMLVYSFSTYQVTNIASILIVVVGSYLLTISSNKGKDIGALIKQRVCQTIYGLFATIFAFVCIFVSSLSAAFVMIKINPSMTYGDVYGAALYVFSAGFFGLQFSQLVLPQKFKRVLYTTDASWYGLITFWAIMVSLSIYAGFKNVASLYFNVYLLAFAFIAAVLNNVIPSTFKMRSAIIFFVQTLVPFVLLMEIELLAMDAMRHSTADGTPEIAGKFYDSYACSQKFCLYI